MRRLLIANRGEIALRIARTARALGLEIVAVYSDPDADAPHVRAADVAYRLGGAAPAESYLNLDAVMDAVRASGADAVHPGYGFLAERPAFAERCVAAGVTFVGPSAAAMRALGHKASSKRLLAGSGVPFLPGYHGTDQSDAALTDAAHRIGVPLMIKASSGGGGRGMRLVLDEASFGEALRSARSEALAAFGDGDVLLERALLAPRHVEVQIFGDAFGNVVHLGERDCSVQRRHQKLIEESPSPAVDAALRERLGAAAIAVARAADYTGAGTVEFLLDADGAFYFIEMNARLQVEHPVTEAVTGFDLVEWQLRVARGEPLPAAQAEIVLRGHAIEARLCAEDPARGFLPQTGTLAAWDPPEHLRVEHALEAGAVVSPFYDSMIAKLVAYGETRDDARAALASGVAACPALGLPTNASALAACLVDDVFAAGAATTRFVDERLAAIDFGAAPSPERVALAGALVFRIAAARGGFGPWTAWSSSALPPAVVPLAIDGAAVRAVEVRPDRADVVDAAVDGASFRIAFAPLRGDDGDGTGSHVRFRIGDGPWRRLTFACAGTTTYLACEGRAYACRDVANEPAAGAAAAAGDGFLRAPMSGRVVGVPAVAGATVRAGDALVVLESMKMEHVLTLPVDTIPRDVTVAAGAQVHANEILLAYEPVVANADSVAR